MIATFDDAAAADHQYLVGVGDGGEAVGDNERRAACPHLAQRGLNRRLGPPVESAGRFVEHQEARIGQERASQAHPLALAARELQTPLTDQRLHLVDGSPSIKRESSAASAAAQTSASSASGRAKAMLA